MACRDGAPGRFMRPTGWRWRLLGPPGPPMTLVLVIAEAVRALVFRHAERHGLMPLPDTLHGAAGGAHTHAHWLVEDDDGDGLADHVLLYAASGLPHSLLPVLAEGGALALRLAGGTRLPAPPGCWRLVPIWMGRAGSAPLLGASSEWRTVTPFVTPQWTRRQSGARAGRDLATQIHRELVVRHLPSPVQLRIEPGQAAAAGWIGPGGFARSPSGRCPPADAEVAHVALRFAAPVSGPLALGFGAHFGLGLFGCRVAGADGALSHLLDKD